MLLTISTNSSKLTFPSPETAETKKQNASHTPTSSPFYYSFLLSFFFFLFLGGFFFFVFPPTSPSKTSAILFPNAILPEFALVPLSPPSPLPSSVAAYFYIFHFFNPSTLRSEFSLSLSRAIKSFTRAEGRRIVAVPALYDPRRGNASPSGTCRSGK